ncbi:RNA-directed DNA polymerase, eukaryota, partial [Tanacetum coccineum]
LGSKAKKDWIKELNNKHKVNFLSVQETKLDCISDMDVKVLWGNYKFEYTISEAVGNSGGILCVWDPSVFHKEHHVVSDNFVALYGSWVSNQAKLLVVSIYAPQSITSKRSLWSYISSLISRWDGHCMVMGDFNEVRCMEDRLGSVYNAQGANEFNSFISNSGLVEIQLEGYSFTWSLQSAKKISKLDRFFFVSDGLLSLLKKLHDIKSSDSRDYIQKAKIQWAIEGDENSNFFHGIINRKRANLAIKGVMVDGEWVDDPCRVKEEFRLHFSNRFRAPTANRCKLNYTFPNRLSSDQLDMLESPISRDEVRNAVWGCGENKSPGPDGFTFEAEDLEQDITKEEVKRAVWDCGVDKSPGPDGFSFYFYRHFWSMIEDDVFGAVEYFFINGDIPRPSRRGFLRASYWFGSLKFSLFFYADDAVFIGEWSIANLSGITHILHCFSLLSGLSINLKKSHLLGVGIRIWIGDTQLRVMFPRIYALEINKDCTVADKLQFSVTSSLRRSVRGGVESSQLALLQKYIEGTLLSNMRDKWVKIPRTCSSVANWLRISSGSYAVGGIYHGRPLVHMPIGLIGSIPSD